MLGAWDQIFILVIIRSYLFQLNDGVKIAS